MILTPMVIAQSTPCSMQNKEIAVVKAATPIYPEAANNLGPSTVVVQVTVNESGALTSARVLQSSGSKAVDAAAVDAVQASTFSPMRYNCAAIGASTLLKVAMNPNGASSIQPGLGNPAASGATQTVCNKADTPATVTKAVSPNVPSSAVLPRSATIVVRVSIEPSGAVSAAKIVQSSGDARVDAAVVKAAQRSTYTPRYVDCEPVASDYLFRIQISSQ
jgi:TonB family protein